MRIYDLFNECNLLEDEIQVGDYFAFDLDDILIETTVIAVTGDGPIVAIDDTALVYLTTEGLFEAEYQGRSVPLGKPMQGDVKKSKVYVKNPSTGKVIKVNFGDKKMRIKKSIPGRRKSFRARHNCENPGPRTKARYWSCRAW
jgi:hypothetical protein